jgi:hypothetical protein
MRRLAIVAGLLVGCHGPDKFDDAVANIEGFKDRMCACQDKTCADTVQADWRAYEKKLRETLGPDGKPSKQQDKRARLLDEAIRVCRGKFDPPSDDAGSAARVRMIEKPTP